MEETLRKIMQITIDDDLIREIANGQWFVMAVLLSLFFVVYLFLTPKYSKYPYKRDWIDKTISVPKQLALSWLILFLGSALRSGYIWTLLHCENLGLNCEWIEAHAYLMFVASTLSLIGALGVIRTVSPQPWRPWSWVAMLVLGLVIPVMFYSSPLSPLP